MLPNKLVQFNANTNSIIKYKEAIALLEEIGFPDIVREWIFRESGRKADTLNMALDLAEIEGGLEVLEFMWGVLDVPKAANVQSNYLKR